MSTAHPAIAAAIPAFTATSTATATAISVAFVLGVTGLFASSAAQTLQTQDPTRPADVWLAAASAPGAASAKAEAQAPGLHILVIGTNRSLAVIDGQVVRLGETYQGAKLVGLDAQGVRLKTPHATMNLQITPAVRKQVHVPQAAPGKPVPNTKKIKGDGL